jgi:predicted MFS family arabinose efflux permease
VNARPPGARFEGWTILVAAMAIVLVGSGVTFSLAIFLRPLEEQFGWTRSLISGIALVNWLIFGLGSFVWGAVSDRLGARRVVLVGATVLGAALLMSSQVTAAWQLYGAFGVVGAAGASAFYAPLSATITRWFQARRGLALGLLNCGMGLGILVVPPLARALITAVGWRATFAAFGVLTWAVALAVTPRLHDHPAARGAVPYGARAVPAAAGRPGAGSPGVLRHPAFWLIALVHFCCCAAHSGPIFHMATHAMDLGVAKMTAASILGVSGGTSLFGRIGGGLLADRIGAKRALVGMLVFQAAMLSLYLVTDTAGGMLPLAMVFGMAYGGAMPLYALVARETFGERVIGAAFGGIFFISCVGMGLGAYAGGLIYDALGSYWTLYAASTLVGAAAIAAALTLPAARGAPVLARG